MLENLITTFIASLSSALIAFGLFHLSQKNETKRWLNSAFVNFEAEQWIKYRTILFKIRFVLLEDIMYWLLGDGIEERIFIQHPLEYFKNIDDTLKEFQYLHNLMAPFFDNVEYEKFNRVEGALDMVKSVCSIYLYGIAMNNYKIESFNKDNNFGYSIKNGNMSINDNDCLENLCNNIGELLEILDAKIIRHKNC